MCRTTRSFKSVDWLQDREIRQPLYPTASQRARKTLSYDTWNIDLKVYWLSQCVAFCRAANVFVYCVQDYSSSFSFFLCILFSVSMPTVTLFSTSLRMQMCVSVSRISSDITKTVNWWLEIENEIEFEFNQSDERKPIFSLVNFALIDQIRIQFQSQSLI